VPVKLQQILPVQTDQPGIFPFSGGQLSPKYPKVLNLHKKGLMQGLFPDVNEQ
jgi:hypothetical protein